MVAHLIQKEMVAGHPNTGGFYHGFDDHTGDVD
jgi:hypothetical protein